jgi:hypothetical protein
MSWNAAIDGLVALFVVLEVLWLAAARGVFFTAGRCSSDRMQGWRFVLLQHEEGCLNWIKFQICLFLVGDFVDVDNLLIFSGDLDFIWVIVVPHLECGQAEWHIK